MKLIESKAEYIPQEEGLEGIYKQIELAGRTAYKSEDKVIDIISIDIASLPENINIEDIPNYKENQQQCIEYLCNHNIKYQVVNSAKDFVDRMIKSKHGAALEAGTVYLYLEVNPENAFKKFEYPLSHFTAGYNWSDAVGNICARYGTNHYSKVASSIEQSKTDDGFNRIVRKYYITSNYRVVIENNWQDDLQFLCPPTEFHEKRYTMRFTCSRAIANELVRHRTMSFLQESTRYINYSKERHGGEITCIEPSWNYKYNDNQFEGAEDWNPYMRALYQAESSYFEMIGDGCTPQQARDVLPNATKTELIMTGFSSDWKHVLDLRLFEKTGKVAPDMLDLMQKAKKAMQEAGVWDDIISKPSKF